MKKAIFSFDYELFFGDKSGTVKSTLIEPTDLLLNQLERSGLTGNFFVDYLMIKYLRQNNDQKSKEDIRLIENQLKDIIRRGHRIELHIHPHWVNARYNGDGTWDFSDFSHYSLNTFSTNQIAEMFHDGIQILLGIIHEVNSEYEIVAFRAGGWVVQPFSTLKKAFIDCGIKIDSSACYGIKNINKDSQYDFTRIPRKEMYRFEDDIEAETPGGRFIEVPISSYYRFMIYKIADRIALKLSNGMRTFADGTHYRSADSTTVKRKLSFFNRAMYNTTCVSVFTAVFSTLLSRKKMIVFIDHPKDFVMDTLKSLNMIGRLVDSITYKDLLRA